MSKHPNFAVGDWIRWLDSERTDPVQVTGYDPVNDLIFWRRDNMLGMAPVGCFLTGRNDAK